MVPTLYLTTFIALLTFFGLSLLFLIFSFFLDFLIFLDFWNFVKETKSKRERHYLGKCHYSTNNELSSLLLLKQSQLNSWKKTFSSTKMKTWVRRGSIWLVELSSEGNWRKRDGGSKWLDLKEKFTLFGGPFRPKWWLNYKSMHPSSSIQTKLRMDSKEKKDVQTPPEKRIAPPPGKF